MADGKIIKRMTYPEQGLISISARAGAGAHDITFIDKVSLAPNEYQCGEPTVEFKFYAIVWRDGLDSGAARKMIQNQVRNNRLNAFTPPLITGFLTPSSPIDNWDEYYRWMSSRQGILAEAEPEDFKVRLENPYHLRTGEGSNPYDALAHGDTFSHQYTVAMFYKQKSPSPTDIIVRIPDANLRVRVDRLNPRPGWGPLEEDTSLLWKYVEQTEISKSFIDKGAHISGNDTEGHTYSDGWGASVSGTNRIMFGESGEQFHKIEWSGPFRLSESGTETCSPRFSITDVVGGGGRTPTPVPTSTPTPEPPTDPPFDDADFDFPDGEGTDVGRVIDFRDPQLRALLDPNGDGVIENGFFVTLPNGFEVLAIGQLGLGPSGITGQSGSVYNGFILRPPRNIDFRSGHAVAQNLGTGSTNSQRGFPGNVQVVHLEGDVQFAVDFNVTAWGGDPAVVVLFTSPARIHELKLLFGRDGTVYSSLEFDPAL